MPVGVIIVVGVLSAISLLTITGVTIYAVNNNNSSSNSTCDCRRRDDNLMKIDDEEYYNISRPKSIYLEKRFDPRNYNKNPQHIKFNGSGEEIDSKLIDHEKREKIKMVI